MAFREYEDQAELKKLQEVTSLVLREFVRVCDLLDIKYVVWAGTAIGVVRHKGFIPWDDDVDVALLRRRLRYLEMRLELTTRERKRIIPLRSRILLPGAR